TRELYGVARDGFDDGILYKINTANGVATQVPTSGLSFLDLSGASGVDMDWDAQSGNLHIVTDNGRHYQYNPRGAVSQDSDIDPGRSIIGIAFSRGTLYGYDYFSDHLVSINTLTGGVTDVNVFRSGGVNQVADSRRFFGLDADSSGALMASVQQ